MNPALIRAQAAKTLAQILSDNGSLASAISLNEKHDEPRIESLPLFREICFGSARWYHYLTLVLQDLLEKPLRRKDRDVHALLIIGLYQLRFMRLADYAVLNETVAATQALKKPWAKSLVNGVLRQYQQQLASATNNDITTTMQVQSFPEWMISAFKQAWPESSPALFINSNERAAMTLRINAKHQSRAEYLEHLASVDIAARPGFLSPFSLYLDTPCEVDLLPGFHQGAVSVQDEASQFVAQLLDLHEGDSLLDLCSAPGGKLAGALESGPSLSRVVAVESDSKRLLKLRNTLNRLALDDLVDLHCSDANALDNWWDGHCFDRIMLDAPCSATGVIRRQPDIKLLRKPADIERLVQLQAALLRTAWQLLEPGGRLVYSTCSILPAENSDQIARFLTDFPEAKSIAIPAKPANSIACAHGLQLLPDPAGSDGFYYMVIEKPGIIH